MGLGSFGRIRIPQELVNLFGGAGRSACGLISLNLSNKRYCGLAFPAKKSAFIGGSELFSIF
jgi:hypothetical protein